MRDPVFQLEAYQQNQRHLQAIPILISLLCEGEKVTIGVGGREAYATKNHIQVPDMPVPRDPKDAARLQFYWTAQRGYIHHERGHIKFTDFDVIASDPLHRALTNAIEDPRQERLEVLEHPGAHWPLNDVSTLLIEQGLEAPAQPTDRPTQVLFAYVHHKLRVEMRQDDALRPLLEADLKVVHAMFPAGFLVRLDALLASAHNLTTTRGAARLARRLLRLIKEEAVNPSPQPHTSSEPQPAATDQGQATASSAPAAQESTQASADDKSGKRKSGRKGSTSVQPIAGPAPAPMAATEAQHQNLKGAATDTRAADIPSRDQQLEALLEQVTEALRRSGDFDMVDLSEAPNAPGGEDTATRGLILDPSAAPSLATVAQASAALRTRLAARLQAATEALTDHRHRGTRLDTRMLHRVYDAVPRVFQHVDEGIDVNAVVYLLIDVSSSMGGTAIQVARDSALACALALDATSGVSLAVSVFPGFGCIKPFDRPVRQCLPNFAVAAHGGTPMKEAIALAARGLVHRPQSRRLIVVVTDGQPNDIVGTQAMIRSATALQIEMIGLGIQCDAVRHLFAVSRVIQQLGELPAALLAALQHQLTCRRAA